ncbi:MULTISPECIES: DUF805 domain-containing protein [Streptomyces]|uniref:DUF805 domain-containing protein n=1 Tax=Streptomyces virginiae TaxID=1961 RepID=A0ABZ1T7F6_STRVG|nr:DUF805 domain-containing protein [Streptomyces virginiae]MCX4956903.1 DUF805 domain-containing protein [Streptomyces virginiae]MCX5175649.1 DUF805 domain-containing protein [Streptomyces virginiae]WTB21392.1 DUF805 domain-containing protein [Streptomyces virginiae]
MNHYTDVLKKYAVFSGRARRQEYWMFTLFQVAIAIVLMILDGLLGTYPLLVGLYFLGTFVPSLAVTVRRLHDLGKSGAWYFIAFVPFIGGIWLLVLTATAGQPQPNEYGADPKAYAA